MVTLDSLVVADKFKDWLDISDPTYNYMLEQACFSDKNLNIIGSAGMGKSVAIQLIFQTLERDNPGTTIVCSTTGKSSVNLQKETIPCSTVHRTFRIPPVSVLERPLYPDENLRGLLEKCKTIIIDETSMASANQFDYLVSLINLNSPDKSFNTIRIILFSDILQLPPVVNLKDPIVKDFYEAKYRNKIMFFNCKSYTERGFEIIKLKKIYRQKELKQQELLERLRFGTPTQEDLDYLNSKVVPLAQYHRTHGAYMYLCSTNKDADALNSAYVRGFNTESKIFRAKCMGDCTLEDFDNLPETIELKIGMQVMCFKNCYSTTNADHDVTSDVNYRNGTTGTVIGFNDENNSVYIEVEENGVKKKKEVVYSETPKYAYRKDLETGRVEHSIVGTVHQIDCRPCKAITVHKSQGSTFDYVYFKNDYLFGDSLVYVALSRLRNLDNLGLSKPLKMSDIRVNKEAIDFLQYVE